jgi:uncharacterized Zn finger protein
MAAGGSQQHWSQWYPPPSAPRPVEGGLRARSRRGAIGESWWSHRFLEMLESFGVGGRLDRGRTYARKGQVISLEVEPGKVTAQVQGSRARPYRVQISLSRLSEADWRRAEDAMVSRAAFVARLLAGEMPDDIEEAFAACSAGLFPARPAELGDDCSCPDWARPCKHVAAVYYLLAEAFDDDPFLIFAWRGRGKDELLANLRTRRGGGRPQSPAPEHDTWPAVAGAPLADCLEGFWDFTGALPEVRPRPAAVADALLRQLDPLGYPGIESLRKVAPEACPAPLQLRATLLEETASEGFAASGGKHQLGAAPGTETDAQAPCPGAATHPDRRQ